ncbi:MAG: hypothetical protein AB1758_11540 [Candidatus Eremiobacterota bacterium]
MRVASLFLLVLLGAAAYAALPPLSPAQQLEQASDVVTGRVLDVSSRIQKVPGGSDRVFQAHVEVAVVEKGSTRPGDTLEVRFRQTHRRPDGWAGPQGQNEALEEDTRVKLFLLRQDGGHYYMLEPNGWEALGD